MMDYTYKRIVKKSIAYMIVLSIAITLGVISVNAGVYRKDFKDVKFSDYSRITQLYIGEDDVELFGGSEDCTLHNMLYLGSIVVDENNPEYSSYKGCLYNKDKTMLLCYPQALRSTEIPRSCINVYPGALYGTSSSVKKQVKAIIARNNGGKWPGYYRYVNNAQDQEQFSGLLKK